MKTYDLIVVGGGASGLCAAIEAKHRARAEGKALSVLVLEKEKYPAKKLLATGNGKCNFANRDISISHYYGETQLAQAVFSRYPASEVPGFLRGLGVPAYDDGSGRLYPVSRKAAGVADALTAGAKSAGAAILCGCGANTIDKTAEGYLVNGEFFAPALSLATGSRAGEGFSDCRTFSFLRQLEVPYSPEIPALCGLLLAQEYPRSLKGARQIGALRLQCDGKDGAWQRGEIQFNEKGVSGIPVLQASLEAGPFLHRGRKVVLTLDLLPDFSVRALAEEAARQARRGEEIPAERKMTAFLPKPLWLYALKQSGLSPAKPLPGDGQALRRLAQNMTWASWLVTGLAGPAQTIRGGAGAAALEETLQAGSSPGLFLCGETVDVTGACGGYNLMWAFCSGRAAGAQAVKYLLEKKRN